MRNHLFWHVHQIVQRLQVCKIQKIISHTWVQNDFENIVLETASDQFLESVDWSKKNKSSQKYPCYLLNWEVPSKRYFFTKQKEPFIWGNMIWTFGGGLWTRRSVIRLEKLEKQRSNLRSVWVPYFHFHGLHSRFELNTAEAHLTQFGRMDTDVVETKNLPLFGDAQEVSCLFNACKCIVLFVEL